MFAIAFDLTVSEAEKHHPKGVSQAYTDIAKILSDYGFKRIQGSLYVTEKEDMANLFAAFQALKGEIWTAEVVRDIRAFRLEQWSDFTPIIKEPKG
jgi:virulence-associated protein VapD